MTGLQMQVLFERNLVNYGQQFAEEEKPYTDTIFKYLNEAQDIYLREKYLPYSLSIDNIKVVNKLEWELHKLIKRKEVSLQPVGDFEYVYVGELPNDYLQYVRSGMGITRNIVYSTDVVTYVSLNYREQSEMHKFISNRFNTVILRTPCVFVSNDVEFNNVTKLPSGGNPTFSENSLKIYVVTDKFTSKQGDLSLTYLKKPNEITLNSDCEFAPQVHIDIVNKAIDLFISQYRKAQLVPNNKNNSKDE